MASTATSGLVKRAADGLTALALIKIAEQFTFPEGGAYPGKPIQLAPNLLHGGAMEPGRTYVPDTAPASQIGFAPQSRRHGASEAAQQLGWAFSDPTMLGAAAAGAGGAGATAGGGGGGTTAAGGGGGGGTTAAAAGGGAAAKGGLGGKPSTRALRARYARGVQRYGLEGFAQRRGMNPEEIGRVVGRRGMARLQSGKNVGRFGIPKTTLGGWRPGSKVAWGGLSALGKLGRVGKWGGLAALGGLGVYGLGNLMGWWGRDKKTTPEAGGKGVSIYSPEERRQFARIGVDPRQAMAAQSAAGALQAGGAFRRAQHQNWLRAANAMMLTGMPDQFNKVPARYAQ